MANQDAPNGFTPLRHRRGGVVRSNAYKIASAYGTAIMAGDAVVLAASGKIERAAAGDVNIAGVFQGVRWIDPDGSVRFSKFWPAGQTTLDSLDAEAMVIDDPDVAFEVQAQGGSFAQTNVGNNADILVNAGDVPTGRSRMAINMAAPAAGTAQLRILGLVDRAGNEAGAFARLEVVFNEHLFKSTAGI
jgi:hypothetical protein